MASRSQSRTHPVHRKYHLVSNDDTSNSAWRDTATGVGDAVRSSRVGAPNNIASPPRHSQQHCVADSKTPVRPLSARTSSAQSNTSRSTHSRTHVSKPAAPVATKQRAMDIYIESDMQDAIFLDPKFAENFLSGGSTKLQSVLDYCHASAAYDRANDQWRLPSEISRESMLYGPVLDILNTIKAGVYRASNPDGDGLEEKDAQFQDCSRRSIASDEAETASIKPDLVLFDGVHEHWETVKMAIEIKKSPGHHKAGMKQLSRYARAVFVHQLHRRHLHGMMVCGTQATFVRFDRAGILFSKPMDLRDDADAFTRAFASLLILDPADEGYDTAFTMRVNRHGRLEYYINLPTAALDNTTSNSTTEGNGGSSLASSDPSTRKFKVIERLCHRKSICGRATIVLRIREAIESDFLDDVDDATRTIKTRAHKELKRKGEEMANEEEPTHYVLKIIWRDSKRGSEGEVMERFRGTFGLAQHVWHCDVLGRCRCSSPSAERCSDCVDQTVQVHGLMVCENLRDISISVPPEDENGNPPELESVDTTEFHQASFRRKRRIYSYILMSTVGVPLWTASGPRQFMSAVLDAILGYWRLVNLGILHRDISDGNAMMLEKGQTFARKEWEEPRMKHPKQLNKALADSEKRLQGVLADLNRDPTGILSDFDLYAKHSDLSSAPLRTPADTPNSAVNVFLKGSTHSTQSHPSTASTENNASVTPNPKRRKTNSRRSVSVPSSVSRPNPSLCLDSAHTPEQTTHVRDGRQAVIDFRTRTPAFMSVRVLMVEPGTPYSHTFMDDLESYFWLILWSAAAHLTTGVAEPTPKAQKVLDAMDQSSLEDLADWKNSKLTHYADTSGYNMKVLLNSFGNE